MDLQAKVETIMNMVGEIHHVVIGSEHDKESGLLQRVKFLEERQDKQESLIKLGKGIIIGMSAPASWGIIQFISSVLIK